MVARRSANGKPLGRPTNESKRAQQMAAMPPSDLKQIAKAAQHINNRYDAAGRGRRMAGWNPPGTGPNSALTGLQNIRNRAHDSARNDWASESAAQKMTTALIGIGITPRFKRVTSIERRREITDLFLDFSKVCDADGVLDVFGQQSLGVRTWFVGGEYFLRRRARFEDEGLPVPFQVQVLEADMCPLLDVDLNGGWQKLPVEHKIRQGIELNKRGKRVAYWFHKEHPADGQNLLSLGENDYIRVAASEVAHVFKPLRPGQMRGVSGLATILTRLRETGDYEDAVLTRQKIANLFVAFIKRTLPSLDPNDPLYGALTGAAAEIGPNQVGTLDDAAGGAPLLPMSPGLMQELEDGQDVTFANPPEAGTTYSDYLRTQTMGTSAAIGLPYELHAGDIREISDRTLRVLINEFRRFAQQNQWQIIIPMHCQRVIDWFADAALLAGKITLAELDDVRRVTHAPHGWEYIHPVQDPQGKALEVEKGFRSRSSVIGEKGDDPDEVDEERKSDLDREKRLDLWVDPNPQPPAPAAAPTPAEDDEEQEREDPEDGPNADLFREVRNLTTTVARMDGMMSAKPEPQQPQSLTIHLPPSSVENNITVEPGPAPNVTVTNQVEPTPVQVHNQVDVTPGAVHVAAPNVSVHNEVQPADVKVELPARKTESTFKRDADGNIVKATQIETSLPPTED
jgi:lambda family phage portal protein